MRAILKGKYGKRLTGILVVLLTMVYLFATGAYAQEANLAAGRTEIQYVKAHISYGDVWSFSEEEYAKSHYTLTGAGNNLEWYIKGGSGVTTKPNEQGTYEGPTYFEKAVINADGTFDNNSSISMKSVSYNSLVSNVSTGSVLSPVGNGVNIPVITASESGGVYSVVPGKTGTYYVHAYVADATEAVLELDYALLDSCGDTNSFAANPFGSETMITLNRIGESNWYRGEISVSAVSWYAYSISGGAASGDSDVGNSGEGTYTGGVETDVSLGGSDTTYYYNAWQSAKVYYDTVLAIKIPAGIALGPISSLGKLTVANNAERGTLTATSIFGESLSLNEPLTIPNMPILLNTQSNGYHVFSGFTSGSQNVLEVQDGVDVANRLKVISEEQTFVYYHEGDSEARDLTMNWSDPVALPTISVAGVTEGTGSFNFINKKEGSGQTARGTKQSVVFTLDFSAANDVASVEYTVKGDSINGVASREGELTAEQNVLTADVMFDVTLVEITATDLNGTPYVFKYTIKPIDSGDAVAKNVSTGKTYVYVEDALVEAASGQQIMLLKSASFVDAALTNGHLSSVWLSDNAGYTVKSGVTLLIPFDDAGTLYTTAPGNDNGAAWVEPTAYSKLTLPSGTSITVNGAISLSAKHHSGGASDQAGSPTGPVSFLQMDEGSSITVKEGGTLYAWGYITGKGTILAESGSTVYENFQINDFRGGSHTAWVTAFGGKDHKVFPFNSYFVQNIEVPLTIKAGATVSCYTTVHASSKPNSAPLPFIGSSGAMFNLTSGELVKDYDEVNDRLIMTVNGDMTVSPLEMTLSGYEFSSSGYNLPINSNITVNVQSGNVTVAQSLAILPGVVVNIAKDAKMTVNKGVNIFVYDLDDWKTTYTYKSGVKFRAIAYAPGRVDKLTDQKLTDATICVNGTIVSTGYLYTTTGGANIYSHGTGVVTTIAGADTVTKQVTGLGSDFGFTAGTTENIPITPAKLQNVDGSFVQSGTDTYTYTDGFWRCATHSIVDGTCSVCGYVSHTCSGTLVSGQASTCTADGWKDYYSCSCDKLYADEACQTQIPDLEAWKTGDGKLTATDHSWTVSYNFAADGTSCIATRTCGNDANHVENATAEITSEVKTPATVTEKGWTTYTATFTEDWAETQTKDVQNIPALTAVAQVGDTKYETLAGALDSVAVGGEVTLLQNITEAATVNKNCIIVKNGYIAALAAADGYVVTERTDDYVIWEDVENITYMANTLDVESKVYLNLKFKIPSTLSDEVVITWTKEDYVRDGKTYSFSDSCTVGELRATPIDNNGRYVLDQDFASGEISGNLSVVFMDGETVLDVYDKNGVKYENGFTRSILDYSAVALEQGSDKMKDLTAALLNFASYAKKYFGVSYADETKSDPSALILNREPNMEAFAECWSTEDTRYNNSYNAVDLGIDTTSIKQSLVLDSDTTIKTFFVLKDGYNIDDLTFTLKYPVQYGTSYETKAIEAELQNDGRYLLSIESIPVAYWNDTYTIIVNSSSVEGTFEFNTSVLVWAKNAINNSSNANTRNMGKAMFTYNYYADEFFTKQ